MKQAIIKECEHYIGNRGIDSPIKKCDKFENSIITYVPPSNCTPNHK